MFAAVNETAKVISPLTTAISNGMLSSVEFVLRTMTRNPSEKTLDELARALKIEYPYESKDYVMHMVQDMYGKKL